MWCRGSGKLDFILVYRNSGEWTLESWMERRLVCAQISVPSAIHQKQLLVCKISVPSAVHQKQLLVCKISVPTTVFQKQ